jgi:predicted metalloprotease
MPRALAVLVALLVALPGSAGAVPAADRATPAPVTGLASADAATGREASGFAEPAVADVDAFWARTFAAADRPYVPPAAVTGFSDPIGTGCGGAWPALHPVFYCGLDHAIYYSDTFRARVEARAGPFGWTAVVAHEWGHHVQALLGFYGSHWATDDGGRLPLQLEQQADCLGGAYAADAEARGWADAADVEQALRVTAAVGDPHGVSWGSAAAHGSSERRVGAFRLGYADGVAGCGLGP